MAMAQAVSTAAGTQRSQRGTWVTTVTPPAGVPRASSLRALADAVRDAAEAPALWGAGRPVVLVVLTRPVFAVAGSSSESAADEPRAGAGAGAHTTDPAGPAGGGGGRGAPARRTRSWRRRRCPGNAFGVGGLGVGGLGVGGSASAGSASAASASAASASAGVDFRRRVA